eukprot:scaffold8843_cov76-Cyclotella_meneghiniana.AAC.7
MSYSARRSIALCAMSGYDGIFPFSDENLSNARWSASTIHNKINQISPPQHIIIMNTAIRGCRALSSV